LRPPPPLLGPLNDRKSCRAHPDTYYNLMLQVAAHVEYTRHCLAVVASVFTFDSRL
jgi:hypothetical protein